MMRKCKDCEKRTIGCHSFCDDYKKDSEEESKKKEALKQHRKDTSEVLYRLHQSGGSKWHK